MLVELPGRQTGTENVSNVGEAFKPFPLNSRFVSRRSFRKVIIIRIVCLLGNDLATLELSSGTIPGSAVGPCTTAVACSPGPANGPKFSPKNKRPVTPSPSSHQPVDLPQ